MNLFELFVKIGADTSQAEKGMKNTEKNAETLTNKIKAMSTQFEAAQENVDKLTQEFNESVNKTGAASKETQELAKKLNDAEKEAEQAKKALDGYNSEVEETEEKTQKASDGLSNFASKLGNGLATAAKIGTAAVGAASAAITALTTQAVNSFAEYEQLAGGASKIFDNMDQTKILGDARKAYKELGLSMNEYLSVINDVGATFAQTMGDESGYNAARKGLKAISDYASGTGKSVDVLSEKFTMITRSASSYQSIADQFSGILPATSADFLEQAKAAGFLSDSYTSLTEVPVAEYQQAVTDMLEKGVADLGLAGNTVAEAENTISGSLNALSASWKNLITGIADDTADFDGLMDDFVDSVKNATKNILPRISDALKGISKMIKELVPVAMEYIPQIITDFLPTIGAAAIGIVTSIGTAIFDNIDQIFEWGQQILDNLLKGIVDNKDSIADVVAEVITSFANFVTENLPEVIEAGVTIILAIVEGLIEAIPELAVAAAELIAELAIMIVSPENLVKLIDLGVDLIGALIEGIGNVISNLVFVGEEIVEKIKEGVSSAWDDFVNWFNGLWNSLFGDREINVNINGTHGSAGGTFANGLTYVPYDGFHAILHEGERVLTAKENKEYNNGSSWNTSGITIIQNIQSVPQTPVELAAATSAYFEQARWAF